MHDATRVVRAGLPPASQGEPFLPGPVFASTYHLAGAPASSPYTYGRYHNPTWDSSARARMLSQLPVFSPPTRRCVGSDTPASRKTRRTN
jgi:cystathionine gamma-lyase